MLHKCRKNAIPPAWVDQHLCPTQDSLVKAAWHRAATPLASDSGIEQYYGQGPNAGPAGGLGGWVDPPVRGLALKPLPAPTPSPLQRGQRAAHRAGPDGGPALALAPPYTSPTHGRGFPRSCGGTSPLRHTTPKPTTCKIESDWSSYASPTSDWALPVAHRGELGSPARGGSTREEVAEHASMNLFTPLAGSWRNTDPCTGGRYLRSQQNFKTVDSDFLSVPSSLSGRSPKGFILNQTGAIALAQHRGSQAQFRTILRPELI
ncbi:hypothetical protein B0H11DRAFT_1908253 [Mycena galericulata]|nr:hypothetical protein B0H11DRAFT_1908253 [Mycena galericulata]